MDFIVLNNFVYLNQFFIESDNKRHVKEIESDQSSFRTQKKMSMHC
jgi:hypothetical protein